MFRISEVNRTNTNLFVKKHISLGSRVADVYRDDIYELPMDSVRELISNAVCHRSYLSPGSIQVAIYDDRLEVTFPGRLSPDLTIDHLIEGNSRVRNIAIGAAFQYMHIIERWGSGIPRVFEDARMYGLGDPEIKDLAPPSVSAFTASRSKPIRSGWLIHQREPLRVKAASQSAMSLKASLKMIPKMNLKMTLKNAISSLKKSSLL